MKLIIWILLNSTPIRAATLEENFGVSIENVKEDLFVYGYKNKLYGTIKILNPTQLINDTGLSHIRHCSMKEKSFDRTKTVFLENTKEVWSTEINDLINPNPKRQARFVGWILGLSLLIGAFYLAIKSAKHFEFLSFSLAKM